MLLATSFHNGIRRTLISRLRRRPDTSELWSNGHLSSRTHHDRRRLPDAARDRRRARQVRHRAGQGETRRGDRPPQPPPSAAAACGYCRRSHAQEHPDDRADRRRQDGDRAPARATGAFTVHQGRSVEVHRGRLCRPRRRVDGARSGGARRRHGARGEGRRSARQGARRRRGASARSAAAAAAPS